MHPLPRDDARQRLQRFIAFEKKQAIAERQGRYDRPQIFLDDSVRAVAQPIQSEHENRGACDQCKKADEPLSPCLRDHLRYASCSLAFRC